MRPSNELYPDWNLCDCPTFAKGFYERAVKNWSFDQNSQVQCWNDKPCLRRIRLAAQLMRQFTIEKYTQEFNAKEWKQGEEQEGSQVIALEFRLFKKADS